MCKTITVVKANEDDVDVLAIMTGELLHEIMTQLDSKVFNFNIDDTRTRAKQLLNEGKYFIFIAKDETSGECLGFVTSYESYALYAEGAYGTIPEFYVRLSYRSKGIGRELLNALYRFGRTKGWKRFEVTTPPLPEFDRTLEFYTRNGFEITGGRKLKREILL